MGLLSFSFVDVVTAFCAHSFFFCWEQCPCHLITSLRFLFGCYVKHIIEQIITWFQWSLNIVFKSFLQLQITCREVFFSFEFVHIFMLYEECTSFFSRCFFSLWSMHDVMLILQPEITIEDMIQILLKFIAHTYTHTHVQSWKIFLDTVVQTAVVWSKCNVLSSIEIFSCCSSGS